MIYCYKAYGLFIESELCLPELIPSSFDAPDVSIYLAAQSQSLSANAGTVQSDAVQSDAVQSDAVQSDAVQGDSVRRVRITQDSISAFWPGVGEFIVRRGQEIVVVPAAGVDDAILRLPLLSAVLAILLHQRGLMVLHASAVEVGNKAVAFLGPKGRGKSSIAATLYTRGHRIVTDDVLAVRIEDGKATVLPAFPHVKLWRGVAAAVLDEAHQQDMSPLYEGIDKGFCLVGDRFVEEPIELHQIYVLAEPLPPLTEIPATETSVLAPLEIQPLEIQPLVIQQTLLELIRHSYLGALSAELIERWQAEHFQQCAHLVGLVAGFGLQRSPDLSSLLPTALAIEENASYTTVGAAVSSFNSY